MSAVKAWWYAKGDQKFGPHTAMELKELAARGQLVAQDMIWKEGFANWLPASSVKGLIPEGAPIAPTVLPPPLPPSAQMNREDIASPPGAFKPPTAGSKWLRAVAWGGGVLLALIIVGALLAPETKTAGHSGETASAAEEIPHVGDTFSTKNFEIQVQSAALRSSVGASWVSSQPSEGGVYVAVVWSYKNISQKPIGTFSQPRIRLLAPDGTKYDQDLGASASFTTELELDSKAFSDLNPGIKVVDAGVFEVSRELFDPSAWVLLIDADKDQRVRLSASPPQASGEPTAVSASADVQLQQTEQVMADAGATSIPSKFQGRWDDVGHCGGDLDPSPVMKITAREITQYEMYCSLTVIDHAEATRFKGSFQCEDSGESYVQFFDMALLEGGLLSVDSGTPLAKCPA
jgi:hypothetical protein